VPKSSVLGEFGDVLAAHFENGGGGGGNGGDGGGGEGAGQRNANVTPSTIEPEVISTPMAPEEREISCSSSPEEPASLGDVTPDSVVSWREPRYEPAFLHLAETMGSSAVVVQETPEQPGPYSPRHSVTEPSHMTN